MSVTRVNWLQTEPSKIEAMKKKSTIHEVKIAYTRPVITEMHQVKSSADAAKLFREFANGRSLDYKEYFFVMLLSRNNRVLGISEISVGSTTATAINVKEVFQLVLKSNACNIVLCHNHPSGNLQPSEQDKAVTKRIALFADLLDVSVLDHLILTTEGYLSMADEGFM